VWFVRRGWCDFVLGAIFFPPVAWEHSTQYQTSLCTASSQRNIQIFMTKEAVLDIFGTIGGVSIALSLVPQVRHTYKRKSAHDISYIYQGIYIFGW
jgi:hypothetical protein